MVIEAENAEWTLRATGNAIQFDRFDVARLRDGLAYGGVSPRSVAEHAALQLADPEGVHVQRYRRSADEPLAWLFDRNDPEKKPL